MFTFFVCAHKSQQAGWFCIAIALNCTALHCTALHTSPYNKMFRSNWLEPYTGRQVSFGFVYKINSLFKVLFKSKYEKIHFHKNRYKLTRSPVFGGSSFVLVRR